MMSFIHAIVTIIYYLMNSKLKNTLFDKIQKYCFNVKMTICNEIMKKKKLNEIVKNILI
jgi:hypothetical protein